MNIMNRIALVGLVLVTFACRGREGTHPEDMSAKQHDAAAADAETKAVEHESQYDPTAVVFDGSDCSEFCFRSNPTEHHLREANRFRREAQRHRDASHDLRVVEERACADIPEIHRDFSPFFHGDHIAGAEIGDSGPVVVHFDQIPKTTAEGLQRLVDCHLARNAAMGFEMEEMDYCPLGVAGVSATVVATDAGLDIQLDAEDEARAAVVTRVEALIADDGNVDSP
jgi:hypothetical protein